MLDLRVATASAQPEIGHVLVLVHGLPRLAGMGRQAAGLLPELAEHVATESGWLVATGTLSGVGASTGTFSATQWRADLARILDRVADGDQRVSLAGFGFGGALALAVAAKDSRVRGVATFAAPAHLRAWAGSPEEIHRAVQVAGVVGDERELLEANRLFKDLLSIDPMKAIAEDPAPTTTHWTRHRRSRGARLRRSRPCGSSRRPRRTSPHSGRGSPAAGRSANGGDAPRLARPSPLRAPRQSPRGGLAPTPRDGATR